MQKSKYLDGQLHSMGYTFAMATHLIVKFRPQASSFALLFLISLFPHFLPAQTAASGFESPGPVEATSFVPADAMTGTLHSVAKQAMNDGLRNTYTLTHGTNTVEILTTPALINRIREVYAIDYLEKLSKEEEFGKAILRAGKAPIDTAVGIVKNPVGTVTGIPKGVSKFFGEIGEGFKGGKSNLEKEGPFAGISGASSTKTKLAIKLGVSPYSTNPVLQRQLNNTARAMAGGGLLVQAALIPVGGPAGAVLTGLSVNSTLQETLINSSPDHLRIVNRKKLFALGLNREEADAFLKHPWYSPWTESIITDALANIGVNPLAFIQSACLAQSSEDAFYFQRVAQLMEHYHKTQGKMAEIRAESGLLVGQDINNMLVVPISLDYAIWTERFAQRADLLIQISQKAKGSKGLSLWVDGTFSPQLCKELKARNIGWRLLALNTPAPQ